MQTLILRAATNPLLPDLGALLLAMLVMAVPVLIVYVWTALALSRVYAKLGVAGWKAWIPIYNAAVFLGLGGFSGWLLLLCLIPVFGAIFVYVAIVTAAYRVNAAFGHGAGMTVLAALAFPVWASILGFGAASPAPVPDAYERRHEQDAATALRTLSPDFGRPAAEEPLFDARQAVLPPSAWIPAASADAFAPPAASLAAPAESFPASVPAPAASAVTPASEPVFADWAAPAAADPAPAVPADPAPSTPPVPAPAAPTAAPDPAPVTSWWMPAPEDAAPAAPVPPVAAAEPAPAVVVPAVPAPPAPPAAPAPAPRPTFREAFLPESDAFPEESGAVSAVAGSPTAGAPLAAVSAVSAFRSGVGEIADDTFIAQRKRAVWALELPDGTAVDLSGETAVLGRRPAPVGSAPGAQLVTIEEETRTVSKTHALLRRQGETWTISDLGSTNGVMVDEVEVEPGQSLALEGEFLLGDATLRLMRRR